MDGSDGSARPTTVENSSLVRKIKISKRASSGNKTVQSPSTARIGASSRSSECIEGSGHKQGNRGQIFENGQHQDNIRCQSYAAAQAVAGSSDGFTLIAGGNESENEDKRLKKFIHNVVDEVTFFEAWLGLTIEDGSADGLIRSVWQRVQVQ